MSVKNYKQKKTTDSGKLIKAVYASYVHVYTGWLKSLCAPDDYNTERGVQRLFVHPVLSISSGHVLIGAIPLCYLNQLKVYSSQSEHNKYIYYQSINLSTCFGSLSQFTNHTEGTFSSCALCSHSIASGWSGLGYNHTRCLFLHMFKRTQSLV
jgi:hypothetical protein